MQTPAGNGSSGTLPPFSCIYDALPGNGQHLHRALWRSLKQQAVYLHEIIDGFQAKRIIDNWIVFYNSERPHTALDKRTPDIAYFGHAEIRKAASTHTRCILAKPQNCPKKQDHFKSRSRIRGGPSNSTNLQPT
jgi:hypothetical protein